ncbi:MAG: N-acetylglucosamine kinase [Friedmanniella sp.]
MSDLVLGADVGGTSTRVAVAALEDSSARAAGVLAVAEGGTGNPNLVGLAASAAEIRTATERALAGVEGTVVGAVFGLAGGSRAAAETGFLAAAVPPGVDVTPELVSDVAVGFSSATPLPNGCILIAGTGAVAGRLVGDRLLDRRDGWGWLLGDRGSGFWLGRQAVRATLDALDEGRRLGPMHRAVLAEAAAPDHLSLVQACYAQPPTWLARFAPLVSRWAEEDEVAGCIADRAADLLAATLGSVRPQAHEPVVLGGSVLATAGPIRTRLASRLPPTLALLDAESGLVGATWIAARRLGRHSDELHRRLSETVRTAPRR